MPFEKAENNLASEQFPSEELAGKEELLPFEELAGNLALEQPPFEELAGNLALKQPPFEELDNNLASEEGVEVPEQLRLEQQTSELQRKTFEKSVAATYIF